MIRPTKLRSLQYRDHRYSVTQLQTWDFGRGCELGDETGLAEIHNFKLVH